MTAKATGTARSPGRVRAFYAALTHAEIGDGARLRGATFFEGCLPIEVMAHRGKDTLRFGPMKPVGLEDPRTGRRAYAVVQLRRTSWPAITSAWSVSRRS